MKLKSLLFDEKAVSRAIMRIAHEIVERNESVENMILVGIKTRGVPLAKIIKDNVLLNAGADLPLYEIDITHYRDDVREEVEVKTQLEQKDVEGKDVILVDDVLFTGRTTRAAIDAVLSVGRANSIRLAVLIDRGHRELPICANYVGKNVPTSKEEFVSVRLREIDGATEVAISKG